MTREEFNKNSYLVNNNALYNKHTEHISTTEPIFIDGMAGSDNIVHEREGDASQNTYWAYEYESGKFMLGKFNEDDIKVKCETDSSDLWIVDAEGVYIEQDALNSYMESDCLDAINAKYGTNFSTLTMQKVKSIDIGDTVTNWNTYEKIELPESKEYLGIDIDDGYAVGYLDNENVYLYSYTSSGNIIVCSSEGRVYQGGEVLNEELITLMSSKLNNAGIQFNEFIGTQTPYQPGETIENWENYRKIS